MQPSKKKKEITKDIEIEFTTSWRSDKREVIVITDGGQVILNEQSEFFIEITSDRTYPLKVQIVPDFDNRKLNFIEVIDPNVVQDDKKGMIKFAGVRIAKKDPLSIDEYLKRWDGSIEDIGKKLKKYEKRKYVLTILLFIVTFINIYLSFINIGILRYINISAAIIATYTLYNLWKSNKKMYEDYEELKKLREEAFEVVKEK